VIAGAPRIPVLHDFSVRVFLRISCRTIKESCARHLSQKAKKISQDPTFRYFAVGNSKKCRAGIRDASAGGSVLPQLEMEKAFIR
jgi:hypothetical protein